MRIKNRWAFPGHELDTLLAEPHLCAASRLCIDAWLDLQSERRIGFGALGPIPVTALLAWCRFHRLDGDVTQLVERVIRRLDNEYLDREASKRNAKEA